MKIDKKEVPDSFQAYLVEGASFTKKRRISHFKREYDFKKYPY